MKKGILIPALLFCAAALFAVPYQLTFGYGRLVVATTATQQLNFMEGTQSVYAVTVSVLNEGTNTVFCAVNIPPSLFDTPAYFSNAVPIPAAMSFAFQGKNLSSLVLKTTNGSAPVCVGAY